MLAAPQVHARAGAYDWIRRELGLPPRKLDIHELSLCYEDGCYGDWADIKQYVIENEDANQFELSLRKLRDDEKPYGLDIPTRRPCFGSDTRHNNISVKRLSKQ